MSSRETSSEVASIAAKLLKLTAKKLSNQALNWTEESCYEEHLKFVHKVSACALGQRQDDPFEWQPIETAPKDGIILCIDEYGDINQIDLDIGTPMFGRLGYTHWMKRPNPPKQENSDDEAN